MSETEEKSLSPPQASVKSYDELLKLLENRTIPRVDVAFLRDHSIASQNESKFIAGLKFLGLVDKDGNATEDMNNLCNVESKRKENLEKTVRTAYSLLFEGIKIDLSNADSEVLVSAFKNDYKMGSMNTAVKGAKVFAYFAQKAGIPISEAILTKLAPSIATKKKPTVPKNKPKREPQKGKPPIANAHTEALPADVIARFELSGTGHVDIRSKEDFAIAKAYWITLCKKLGISDKDAS